MWFRRAPWRRQARPVTFTVHNGRAANITLWLEPWCEEFDVPPGGRLDLVLSGAFELPADARFEWTDDLLIFYAPAGSRVLVMVDGDIQDSGSAEIAVPSAGNLDTRGFVQTVFEPFPEASAAGSAAKTSPLPALRAPMAGAHCRAEPYSEEHRDSLKAACAEDLDIWTIYSWSFDPEHFDETLSRLNSRPANQLFVLFSRGELAGMSAYLGIDPERQVLEIGNTYFRPHLRGTGFNLNAKDMMLRRAFDCGIRRVEFRVDSRNQRSQAAMAKIGGVREGVLRADRITWTGHVRDTVLFSILADEWPSTAG